MAEGLHRILALEVPIIVQLGQRKLPLGDVVSLIPGAIIELPKAATEELELLVNNKVIGTGTAVKVGENFGLRVMHIGDARERIRAMADAAESIAAAPEAAAAETDEIPAEEAPAPVARAA